LLKQNFVNFIPELTVSATASQNPDALENINKKIIISYIHNDDAILFKT